MLPLSDQTALHQYTTLAPAFARCPRCGALSQRNEIRRRSFWMPDLERPRIWHFDTGCYLRLSTTIQRETPNRSSVTVSARRGTGPGCQPPDRARGAAA